MIPPRLLFGLLPPTHRAFSSQGPRGLLGPKGPPGILGPQVSAGEEGVPREPPPTLAASFGPTTDHRLWPVFPFAGRAWRGRPPRTEGGPGKWTEAKAAAVGFGRVGQGMLKSF